MIISQAQLDTLMYWAKLGVSGFVPHANQYRRLYPNRIDPHAKIHAIESKVLSTKQPLIELKQLAKKHSAV